MSAPPTASDSGFVSPLAPQLARFLALKHAMGYRYREEGRALRELDRFLKTRLSAADPLITPAIIHDYVARRGTESETTRAHRLTLIRKVCRFLRLDDPRVAGACLPSHPACFSSRICHSDQSPRCPRLCRLDRAGHRGLGHRNRVDYETSEPVFIPGHFSRRTDHRRCR